MKDVSRTLNDALVALNQKIFAGPKGYFEKVVQANPSHVPALNLLTVTLMASDRFAEAEPFIARATALNQTSDVSFYNFGLILKRLNKPQQALAKFNKALGLNSMIADTWNNRGTVFNDLKQFDQAVADFDKAIQLNPRYADAYCNKGGSFSELGRNNDALVCFDKALSIDPNLSHAWVGRGNVLHNLEEYEKALIAYDKALSLDPTSAGAWIGRGNVLCDKNLSAEALSCFDKAIELAPDFADAYWNKARLKLLLGEYEEGWRLYEWRWKYRKFTAPERNFAKPLWLNQTKLTGKTLLVHAEQGLGDTIQFMRYVKRLDLSNNRVIFEVPKPLVQLVRDQNLQCDVLSQGDILPNFDLQCPLMSLPHAFQTTIETVPADIPYIEPENDRARSWATLMGPRSKPRIGLSWSGNPEHINDAKRSVDLTAFRDLLSQRFEWFVAQKDIREKDRLFLQELSLIRDYSQEIKDFSDTAAMISNLDLVISVDTSTAHLAGAMGKPVWILLPFYPDYRWLRDGTVSPWYPTATLYRQIADGEWADVLKRVAFDLRNSFSNLSLDSAKN